MDFKKVRFECILFGGQSQDKVKDEQRGEYLKCGGRQHNEVVVCLWVSAKVITLQITKRTYKTCAYETQKYRYKFTTSIKKKMAERPRCSLLISLCFSILMSALRSSHVSYGLIIPPRAGLPSHT